MWWTLGADQVHARWDGRDIEATWSPRQPQRGLTFQIVNRPQHHFGMVWFGAWDNAPPGEPDLHLRQRDCIATYEQASGDQLRCQLEWRLFESPQGVGIDLVVSTQTSLLQSSPRASIGSTWDNYPWFRTPIGSLATGGSSWITDGDDELHGGTPKEGELLLVRATKRHSYVEMVHPADRLATDGIRVMQQGDRYRSTTTLFDASLEKGVICRARWRCAWVERSHDLAAAAALATDLLAQPLPLTT